VFASEKNEERQFSDIVMEKEEDEQNLNSVQEGNETAESHVHAHAHLSGSNGFQPTVEAENEDLAYDGGQEQ